MKHREKYSSGSFTAWGTGFNYEYHSGLKKLDILHAKTGSALLFIDVDKHLSRDPDFFVSLLDKSCQIRALALTNNASIDLSTTFDDRKLTPMLQETARLSRLGFDLMQENYERFERYFCQDSSLRAMKIQKLRKFEGGIDLFSAELETRHSSRIMVESPSLHGIMSTLSQKIVQDLIPREFVSCFDAFAQTLLKTSSNISILSLILNEKFSPAYKMQGIVNNKLRNQQTNL